MKVTVGNWICSISRITSFFAAILVVAIHANSLHWAESPSSWNITIHKCLCQGLNVWAVPFFFALSGFWFALGDYANGGGGIVCF